MAWVVKPTAEAVILPSPDGKSGRRESIAFHTVVFSALASSATSHSLCLKVKTEKNKSLERPPGIARDQTSPDTPKPAGQSRPDITQAW